MKCAAFVVSRTQSNLFEMAGSVAILQLISIFFCCVSGAYLQYGSTALYDSPSNVTLTVGTTNQRVFCLQATGPVPTSIEWYNPQGQLVSRDNREEVNQAGGGDRIAILTFRSYQQSQGGAYECRVAGPGNNTESLLVCIAPFPSVSGAYLQYGSTRLSGIHLSVTLTVGMSNQRVHCEQMRGPLPTSIEWYDPQGQLVSRNNREEVNQVAGRGCGKAAVLTFRSYQQCQGGKYKCRVAGPGNNLETLSVWIAPYPSVSGAFLQYGSTHLSGIHPSVTLTVGRSNQRVHCEQMTGPLPISIEWYNPQGQLVPRDSSEEVNQVAGRSCGKAAVLTFQSYQQCQGGKYKCRVAGPGNNLKTLSVWIGPTGKFCVWITPGVQNTYLTLTVMWQLFASEAVNYTVKYSTQPGEVNNASEGALEVIEISGTSTILTALKRGTTYYIWVVGVSEGGKRLYSDRKIGVTFDNVPTPTNGGVSVVALNEAGKVRVTWSSPTLGPGQVITGYSVQYRRRGTTSYTTRSVSGSSTTSYNITNLNRGTVYEVRVASVGPLGLSGYCCGIGKQVTTYNNVHHPTDGSVSVVALKEGGKVRVTWSIPTLGPGQVITGYTVQYRRRGTTSYTTRSVSGSSSTSYTITNLTLGTVYEVRVASVGPLGLSGYCCGSGKQVTTYNTLEPPLLSITSGSSWLYVEWNAQSATFRVLYRENGAPDYQVIVPTTSQVSHNISALQPNTLYNIVVEASHTVTQLKVNSSVTTAYTTPQAPSRVSAQAASSDSIKVTWTPAPTASSVSVTYYINASSSTYQTVRKTVSDPDREVVISGLHPFAEYYITVQAGNPGGLSEPTGRSAATLTAAPGPVRELGYKVKTNTSVNITWKPPKEPNGDIVAYFVEHGVYQNESTTSVEVTDKQQVQRVIQNLNPGVPYNVTVRAITAVEKGEPVSIVVFAVEQAPTAQVSNVKVERVNNNRAARVSWTPLTLHQARGFPVYFVTYQPSSQVGGVARAINTVNTTDSSVMIDDLDPTTECTFTVDVGTAGGKLRSLRGAVNVTLLRVEPENSISATGVGLLLGGVVAGVLGVLLMIVGIVYGVWRLMRNKHRKSSPSGTATDDVPMKDNPAYRVFNM